MSQATTSIMSDTRYTPRYFGSVPRAEKSLAQAGHTAMALPLFSAVLSFFAVPGDNMFYPGTVVCLCRICGCL
jgi:hypothetical protein